MRILTKNLRIALRVLAAGRPAIAAWTEAFPQWSMAASACPIGPETSRIIQLDPALQDPNVQHQLVHDVADPRQQREYAGSEYVDATGLIVARCPLTNPMDVVTATDPANPRWNHLAVSFLDPSGCSDAVGDGYKASVRVKLVRVARSTGVWATVAELLPNRDPANYFHEAQIPFSHSWDFRNNTYYVEIEMYQNSAAPFSYVTMVRLLRG